MSLELVKNHYMENILMPLDKSVGKSWDSPQQIRIYENL